MLHAVIMAGGAGTRFWPASRAQLPKQLLRLTGDRTMIQSTLDRVRGLIDPEQVLVVTNQSLVQLVREQLPELPVDSILGEPCKRDTAPCIGLAAGIIARRDPDATMVVMPADHVIFPTEQFQNAIRKAVDLVDEDPARIVTFGIKPTYPAETYGYIERDVKSVAENAFAVKMFREKPNAETAAAYLESGRFYWNSGIFVWRAATIWNALRKFEPGMFQHLSNITSAHGTSGFPNAFAKHFGEIQGKSIDYAVMERYSKVVVIEVPFEWDDVGNWRSIARLEGVDSAGNTVMGRHVGIGTKHTIVRSDDQHLIVTIGLEDCIVVRTPDATLVARKQDEESVRKVVELLKEKGWTEYL